MRHRVFLGLGSNLGDRQAQLRQAVRLIGERVGRVLRQSDFIETEPWGFQSQHPFLNAVVLCETAAAPREVLSLTQQIERDLGRQTKSVGGAYADRSIDIDILLYDRLMVDEPGLTIPHPLMLQRDFVMKPLLQVLKEMKEGKNEKMKK